MVYVSVSAYNDAAVLRGCLESVREVLPDATVTVVDGRYETFAPDAADNSTDATPTVAGEFGAAYDPGGPFELEVDKHRYRVVQAPADEQAIFIDADERVVCADLDRLPVDRAYAARIFNTVVYSESPIVYWPRVFRPGDVREVSRWDAYYFEVPCSRTDAVTIAHRHDLRDREYREAKYDRFHREGRTGRYDDRFAKYLTNGWDVPTVACPSCGQDSLVRSPATNEGSEFSRVEVCIAGDGCHGSVERINPGTYRYLPEAWERGLEADPERLRLELLDAGADFLAMHDFSQATTGADIAPYKPLIRLFVEDTFGEGESRVFGAND